MVIVKWHHGFNGEFLMQHVFFVVPVVSKATKNIFHIPQQELPLVPIPPSEIILCHISV